MSFFDDVKDVDFRIRTFSVLCGVWVIINFLGQLPLFDSLWGETNQLVLSRSAHGVNLSVVLDLLTYFPQLTIPCYVIALGLAFMVITNRTNLLIRIGLWLAVWLLDAKAWTVQDGGNNLIHLTLFYSIFFDFKSKDVELQKFVRNLAVRAIQVQVLIVYFCAFSSKLGGELWQNGTAVFYVIQVDKFKSDFLSQVFDLFPLLVPILTYSTIVSQLFIGVALSFKKWRVAAIAIGTILHLGIAASMGLVAFSLVMIIHYSIFMTEEDLSLIRRFVPRFHALARPISLMTVCVLLVSCCNGSDREKSKFFEKDLISIISTNLKPASKLFILDSRFAGAELISSTGIEFLTSTQANEIELEYGSVTKLFTAVKFLELEKKGLINRSQEYKLSNGKIVTLNDLLKHQSGVNDLDQKTYEVKSDSTFRYSNFNYSFIGDVIKKKTGSPAMNELDYKLSRRRTLLLNEKNRPEIIENMKSAFGMVGNSDKLIQLMKSPIIKAIPCTKKGSCWGGYKIGDYFYSVGKLASGTTLVRVSKNGDVLVLSSNDHTLDLVRIESVLF